MKSKKQLFDLSLEIQHFARKEWDASVGSYKPTLAASLLIEEALELLGCPTAKELARDIVIANTDHDRTVPRADLFDGHLDSIYINLTELQKLGITAYQITDGLQAVHDANKQKIGTKDEFGKITKPAEFIPPNETLQRILDRG